MKDYKLEGWATFGKGTAWAASIAAVIGAVYGIGTLVYDAGKSAGTLIGKEEVTSEYKTREAQITDSWRKNAGKLELRLQEENKAHASVMEDLAQDGRLIEEKSCLRYAAGANQEVIKAAGKKDCPKNLYFVVDLDVNGSPTAVTTEFGTMRTSISRYGTADVSKHVAEDWVPVK